MLSAQTIRKRWEEGDLQIEPFCERAKAHGRSYGLSSCGYDVRIAEDVWLWPLHGLLASIMEYISLPDDLSAEVKDKSTNARLFVFVQNTIIEPGWEGYLTVELTRLLPWPILIKKGTPIAQVVFHQLDQPTEQPYRGKYQGQASGPQKARFER
jgi:dCTP deaminase